MVEAYLNWMLKLCCNHFFLFKFWFIINFIFIQKGYLSSKYLFYQWDLLKHEDAKQAKDRRKREIRSNEHNPFLHKYVWLASLLTMCLT